MNRSFLIDVQSYGKQLAKVQMLLSDFSPLPLFSSPFLVSSPCLEPASRISMWSRRHISTRVMVSCRTEKEADYDFNQDEIQIETRCTSTFRRQSRRIIQRLPSPSTINFNHVSRETSVPAAIPDLKSAIERRDQVVPQMHSSADSQ